MNLDPFLRTWIRFCALPPVSARYTRRMGMYDEIDCQAPLPDGYTAGGRPFQTKSFPSPGLDRYTITAAGRLVDRLGNDLEPEGYLAFYTDSAPDNPSQGGDKSSRWREYRAHFVDGQLDTIVVVEDAAIERHYYGLASFRWFDTPPPFAAHPDAADAKKRSRR